MKRVVFVIGLAVTVAVGASAQDATTRAWQTRLKVEAPLPVPVVAVEAVNPFATSLDEPPTLIRGVPPRKLQISGRARLAAYVDVKGNCPGAVPLSAPFPGMTQALVSALAGTRFRPALIGKAARPSWTVVEVTLGAKIKESAVIEQRLVGPDPQAPPSRPAPAQRYPAGRLANLPAADPATLSTRAVPRNVKVRVPGHEAAIGLRALVHITAEGACDRFVPLEVDSGFVPWLSAYLATWRLTPAQSEGQPVASWMEYTARVRLKLSTMRSTAARVLGDVYSPTGNVGAVGE